MNPHAIKDLSEKSIAGKITFPEVVKTLLEGGVESYTVDLFQNLKTFYSVTGEVYTETFTFQGPPVAHDFSADGIVNAIRSTQAGKITYPVFLDSIMKAGCYTYTVYLTGKKVIYNGRRGGFHIENFPQPEK